LLLLTFNSAPLRISSISEEHFIDSSIIYQSPTTFTMPPKKASTGAAATSASKKAAPSHSSYRDMIKDAIVSLKERNGSSRQSIKKYVQNNNKITVVSQAAFDSQFNKAIKAGVEKGEFSQPKGPSGPVKLAKKETAAKPAAKKPAAAKPAAPKKTTVKKAAPAAKPS
jgi:histone H1/5